MGFWEGLGCFWRFRFLCVRACVTLYVPSFVGWTCSRVLVRSTWNLFRSTIYELTLCTSYFWSMSIRPSVRQNGRNIAHTGLGVIFMARLTVVRGPCFCLVRPSVHPSVRPSMGVNFFVWKHVLWGFEKVWGVFDVFDFCPCVRACVTLYVLSFVDWTCPRVLVRSTWNLFRSTIYELKLCTFYFWSTSVRPSVRQNGRNIASHTGLLVIFFFSILWIELVLGF